MPTTPDELSDVRGSHALNHLNLRRTWSSRAGFALVAVTLVSFLAAASAPSPLYVVYQQRWGFSAGTLTVIFGSYAIALLLALITVGGISDFVGRRPVLVTALLLEAVAMALFVMAGDVTGLLAARVVQGLATGAATGVASAALVDLAPPDRGHLGPLLNSAGSSAGLALGALVAGALAQVAPGSPWLVFAGLLVLMLILAALSTRLPESVTPRAGALASLRPRMAVPPQARRPFLAALPMLVATWSMGALYLSLAPSIAARVLGIEGHFIEAAIVAAFAAMGAVGAVLARNEPPGRVTPVAALLLTVGTAAIAAGTATASVPPYLLGTAVAGAGFGSGFLAAFRSLTGLAAPDQRAELLASIFLVNYLAFSSPAVIAGELVPVLGLRVTAVGYAGVVVVLSLLAFLLAAVRRR